jgi:hypothetical protein
MVRLHVLRHAMKGKSYLMWREGCVCKTFRRLYPATPLGLEGLALAELRLKEPVREVGA